MKPEQQALAPGSQLGPYEIVAPIGAGGMGQVYRARDTRLGRTVAVKVLPPNLSMNPALRLRFEQEARAVSALSHPNVCALYDVGQAKISSNGDSASVSFIVMEYLDGEDLRTRIDHGRITIRRALECAIQVANGLAAAHEQGVIHRDLKPENIFITRAGSVKILDFGLAKLAPELSGENGSSTLLQTLPGTIMGTVNYMSPEQVRGAALDHRSDLFSCGSVLYEMLSGRQPFRESSPAETMSAILKEDPEELTALVRDLPPGVAHVVERCLEKDPDRRFGSARDLAFSLEALSFPHDMPSSGPKKLPSRPNPRMVTKKRAAILAALLAVIVSIAGVARFADRFDDVEPPQVRTLTHAGQDRSPAASPDGKMIAFVSERDGKRRIWLKQLSDGTEVALTDGPDDSAPRFAPDGTSLLFTRATAEGLAIHRVAVVGGQPRKLIDNAFDGDFSPDGRFVAFIRNREGATRLTTLCIASLQNGTVREVASSTTDDYQFPRWSPDGRLIAVTQNPRSAQGGSVLIADAEGDGRDVLVNRAPHGKLSGVVWASDDAIVYAELEPQVALSSALRGGPARVVLHDVSRGRERTVLWNPHALVDAIDVCGDGCLVYAEDSTGQSLQEISLLGTGPRHWLTHGSGIDRQPSYAANGEQIVFASDRSGNADIWSLARNGNLQRLTDHEAVDWDPVTSADGKHLLWSSNRGGHFEIWMAGIDGGNPRQVTTDGADAENPTMPRDGSWIYYDSSNPEKEGLWRVRPDGSGAMRVFSGETIHPEVSADGEYVVYQRPEEAGTAAIDVLRVADGMVFTLVRNLNRFHTSRPRWIDGTHAIAYRAEDGPRGLGLWAQEFVPGEDTTGIRKPLAGFDGETSVESYATSPDGTRAVLSLIEPSSALMTARGVGGVRQR